MLNDTTTGMVAEVHKLASKFEALGSCVKKAVGLAELLREMRVHSCHQDKELSESNKRISALVDRMIELERQNSESSKKSVDLGGLSDRYCDLAK